MIATEPGIFAPQVNYAGVGNPSSLIIGDFNEDNHQDIAVVSNTNDNVVIFLGTGTGTFGTGTPFTAGNSPMDVKIGDFNNDDHQDLMIVNTNSKLASVLLGTGTGTFGSPVNFPLIPTSARSVIVGDLNNDGNDDAVFFGGHYSIFLGDGNVGFTQTSYTPLRGIDDAKLIDMNDDGYLDMVSSIGAGATAGSFSIHLGDGSGAFNTETYFLAPQSNFYTVTVGKFH